MKFPCPQCGGEILLQEAGGFPVCPFCAAGLVLDLGGVRPHLLYRPRHASTDILPLLRRWCDQQGLPAPSIVSVPRLVYYPFWRYVSAGPPRLIPAWSTLKPRWADLKIPEAEQAFFDPALVARAEVVEATLPEAAARERAGPESGAKPGDLLHVPFFEVGVKVGTATVPASVEACSGQVYVDALPRAAAAAGAGPAVRLVMGALLMLVEAALLPRAWVALPVVFVTAWLTYLAIRGGLENPSP
ncbi:MAG: hypothetical protein NTW68_19025 [candidate division NC10 bacterium]|nr:hypothetical protein [candidate division NC10 bacterium]